MTSGEQSSTCKLCGLGQLVPLLWASVSYLWVVHWFHDHLWAPKTQSSFLLPPNPEIRHLPYLDHEGRCSESGNPTGTVSKLWGDKWQSTPGYCTPRPCSIRTTRFQGAVAFNRRAGQRTHFQRGKAQAPPSPDMACCRDQVGHQAQCLLAGLAHAQHLPLSGLI